MSTPDQTRHRGEWRPSANLPPLSRLDIAGILVAVVGTLILILLATGTAANDSGGLGSVSAARILIAVAATLVNLAHVVGIILFESVDYHGPFQRFFAKLSLIGTPLAIVASLAVGLL